MNQATGKRLRVLYVDDSKAVRDSAAAIFNNRGFETVTARDGFEALCLLAGQPQQIIFMEIMMPRLDGFQTCALIMSSERFSTIPVVLVSATAGPLEKAKAELSGARRFLQKPFAGKELLAIVQELAHADDTQH